MAQLPIVKLFYDAKQGEWDEETGKEKLYYADLRLREYRAVDNPHDVVKERDIDADMEEIIEQYGVKKLMKPTIHRNGTGKNELLKQALDAVHAVHAAIEAVSSAQPNARDYYTQGPDAIRAAMTEHEARIAKLKEVESEFTELAIHIVDAD